MIRPSQLSDRAALAELWQTDDHQQVYGKTSTMNDTARNWIADLWLSFIERTPGFTLMLANADGLVVGTALLHPAGVVPQLAYQPERHVYDFTIDRGCDVGEIDDLYVRPEHRNQGIASSLVRAAIDEARRYPYLRVQARSLSPSAIKAMTKAGMLYYRTEGDMTCVTTSDVE